MTAKTDKKPSSNGSSDVAEAPDEPVLLERVARHRLLVEVEGLTPLISHRWSEKAKKQMREAQQSKSRKKKEPKDPVAEFNAARYRMTDGRDGFPATGFKAAIVGATRHFDGITMVQAKQSIWVAGEPTDDGLLVPIDFGEDEPRMREDSVRVGMGTADLRYRPEYWPWSATLDVQFLATFLDRKSVLALVEAAGFGGVGEWRPSSPKGATGMYGTWEISQSMWEED